MSSEKDERTIADLQAKLKASNPDAASSTPVKESEKEQEARWRKEAEDKAAKNSNATPTRLFPTYKEQQLKIRKQVEGSTDTEKGKEWKERYVVLKKEALAFYIERNGKLAFSFELAGVVDVELEMTPDKIPGFHVFTKFARVYFRCDSEADRDEWIKAIERQWDEVKAAQPAPEKKGLSLSGLKEALSPRGNKSADAPSSPRKKDKDDGDKKDGEKEKKDKDGGILKMISPRGKK